MLASREAAMKVGDVRKRLRIRGVIHQTEHVAIVQWVEALAESGSGKIGRRFVMTLVKDVIRSVVRRNASQLHRQRRSGWVRVSGGGQKVGTTRSEITYHQQLWLVASIGWVDKVDRLDHLTQGLAIGAERGLGSEG